MINVEDVKNFPCTNDIDVHFEKLDGTKYEAKRIEGEAVTTSTNETSIIAADEHSSTNISILSSQPHEEFELRNTTNTKSVQTESRVLKKHKFHGEYELQVGSKSADIRLVARTSYGYKAQYEFTIPAGKT